MTLAYGHASSLLLEYESSYKTLASGTAWKRLPVAEFRPGIAQQWERQDVFGIAGGRDDPDPQRGLLVVDPSVVVPVDLVGIGYWLKMLFGAPSTSGSSDYTHTWKSGSTTALPSASLEHANAFTTNGYARFLGCRADTLEINFAFGAVQQQATIGMIGASTTRTNSSVDGSPTDPTFTPFTGAVGTATREGSALARVTGATLRFSNGLEKLLEANRDGAALAEAASGITEVTGTVDLRMDNDDLLADSEGTAPIALAFGYSISATQLLTFTVPEAYLDRAAMPVRGRAGIQASFRFRGAYNASATTSLTVVLKNQQAAYS